MEAQETKRMGGFIERVKNDAFGFIRGEDGKDYFLHKSNISPRSALAVGAAVDFVPGPQVDGKAAPALEARPRAS